MSTNHKGCNCEPTDCGCSSGGNYTYVRYAIDSNGTDIANTINAGGIKRCFMATITSSAPLDESSPLFPNHFTGHWVDFCKDASGSSGCVKFGYITKNETQNVWIWDGNFSSGSFVPSVENKIIINSGVDGRTYAINMLSLYMPLPIENGKYYYFEFDYDFLNLNVGDSVTLSLGDGLTATKQTFTNSEGSGRFIGLLKAQSGLNFGPSYLLIKIETSGGDCGDFSLTNFQLGSSSCFAKTSDFINDGEDGTSRYVEEKDIEGLLDIKEDGVELIQDYVTIGTVTGESQKEYNEKNQAIIAALIGNVPHPNYLSPTMNMTQPSTPQKVGASYDVNLTLTYTKRDGGNATAYKIEKDTVEVSTTNTYSELGFIIPIGLTTYKGTINYAQGAIKNNSIGIPDPFGRIPAGALSKTVTIEGVYPLFGTTSSITVGTEQSLVSMINANNIVLNLVAESGGNKQFFDIPQIWLDSRPLTKIEFFDFNNNAWNSQNQLSTFTAVVNTHVVNGNTINYKRYTNNGSNRGAIRMRLIF